MLLNSVKLQGFLSHRGHEVGGVMTPNELDFRESNLWLMHGPNGTGKSSVFDAITFALFGKARGSRMLQLVNDRSDSARVEVEFEVDGQRFLVQRNIKLSKKRDTSKLTNQVLRWNADREDWDFEKGVDDVAVWCEKTLKVSYENFVSSVILEQGRADQFLRAEPRKRRESLVELLDLQVYEEIDRATAARYALAKREADAKERQLAACTPVEPTEIEAATLAVGAAQTRVERARTVTSGAKKKWDDAQLAAAKAADIAAQSALLVHDKTLTDDADAIEAAAARREEIGAALPALNALRNARRAHANAETEAANAREKLKLARTRETELAPEREQTREQNEQTAQAVTAAKLREQASEIARKDAAHNAEISRQIEQKETLLARCVEDLAPHRKWLERAAEIEGRREEIERLTTIAQKIKPLKEARAALERARDWERETDEAHRKASELARDSEQELERASQAKAANEAALDEARAQQLEIAAQLKAQSQLWQSRKDLGDEDECPTCGTILDDPDAHARLHAEREILGREVAQLQERDAELKGRVQTLSDERKEAMSAEKAAQTARDGAVKAAGRTEAQWDGAKRDAAAKERDLEERRDEAGEWAGEDFEAIRARANTLDKEHIGAEVAALQAAQKAETQSEAVAQTYRAQLQELPDWNAEKRASVEELERVSQGDYESALQALQRAQNAAEAARARYDAAQRDWSDARNQVEFAVEIEAAKKAASANAKRDWDEYLAQLSPDWNAHLAASDDEALDELRAEFGELEPLASRLSELRAAQQRVSNLQSRIAVLQEQLEEIAAENRVEPAQAKRELDEAQTALREGENDWETARGALAHAQKLRDEWVRCEAERDAAQTEAGRYKDLAEALGAQGLKSRIVNQAQERLRDAANDILGRLSKYQWQMDLRVKGDEEKNKELEIFARDEGRGGHERAFDTLSGGERFRVAISLAIAIGQMASGGTPMNTLVIDEGFGALDEENRGLMVDNLRHLSENELKNGRIIVVSHQDDVREAFGHRYQLSRDADGYANVEMTIG